MQEKGCCNCANRVYLSNYCAAIDGDVSLFPPERWERIERALGKDRCRPASKVVDAEKCPHYKWSGTRVAGVKDQQDGGVKK